jgi:hypothetical protein
MQTERWLPVPIEPYTEFYEVSTEGRVRSKDRVVTERNTLKKRISKGRIITPKRSGNYLGVSLFAGEQSERFYIHRLVALTFIQNPEEKPCVNHKNRNREDNTVSNLEWVTYKENTEHMYTLKDWETNPVKGTDHHDARFNDEQIRKLRLEWKPGDKTTKIAKHYNVTPRTIYKILSGDTWKHISPSRAVHWPNKDGDGDSVT